MKLNIDWEELNHLDLADMGSWPGVAKGLVTLVLVLLIGILS